MAVVRAQFKLGIDSLPTEIKIRIAELCGQQDEVLLDAWSRLTACGTTASHRWTTERAARPGTSLSALSRASRAWHDIAAPVLYRRVSLSKLDSFFLLRIGLRYGHLVEEVSADRRNRLPRVAAILGSLNMLANVKHIVVPSVTTLAQLLTSEDPIPGLGQDPVAIDAYITMKLGYFISGVRSVEIPAASYSDGLQLCCGSAITKLQITFDADGHLEPFIAAMARLEALVELRLALNTQYNMLDHELGLSPLSDRPGFSVPKTLRHLAVSTHTPAESIYRFVADLAPTVEYLTVEFRAMSSPAVPPAAVTTWPKFPRVEVLTVEGQSRATTHFLASASSTVFPRLREIAWRGSSGQPCAQNEEKTLRAFLAGQSASTFPLNAWLEDRLHRCDPFELADSTTGRQLRVRCRASQLQRRDPPPYPSVSFTNPQASHYLSEDALHDDISSSIAYAQRMADQALAVGDHFQLDRLVQVFRELELLRMEQRS